MNIEDTSESNENSSTGAFYAFFPWDTSSLAPRDGSFSEMESVKNKRYPKKNFKVAINHGDGTVSVPILKKLMMFLVTEKNYVKIEKLLRSFRF